MDDLTQRYFEAEMRYLREAGKEFAQAYPDRAAMLNLDKPGARDPYVERLFEGFAFLMGRLREKLDDDLPELTEGLVSLLPAARLGKQRVQISRTGILRASFAAPATGTVTVSLGSYQGLIPAFSIRNRESMTHVSYSF